MFVYKAWGYGGGSGGGKGEGECCFKIRAEKN